MKKEISIRGSTFVIKYNRIGIVCNENAIENRSNRTQKIKITYNGENDLVYKLKKDIVCWSKENGNNKFASTEKYSKFNDLITIEVQAREELILDDLFILQTFNKRDNILYVGDKFTYDSIKNMFNVTSINRNHIKYISDILQAGVKFEMLFIESFWNGHSRSWHYLSEGIEKDLGALVNVCKENGVKIVFYNKEDPFHYRDFLWVAKLSDHILTIDSECVEKYKQEYPNKKVDYFGFIVDERVFHYNKLNNKEDTIFYSAAYYADRFDDRKEFFSEFVKFIEKEKINFEIIDRYYQKNDEKFQFPEYCNKYINTGRLNPVELKEYTKNFKYSLNINSVSDSKSFIARRVFEHIALGKIVISNYALSYENFNNKLLIYSKENTIKEIFDIISKMELTTEDIRLSSLEVLCTYGTVASKNKMKKLGIIENNNIMTDEEVKNEVIDLINKGEK